MTVSQTTPVAPAAATVANPVYQVWQGLQGAVLCDADRVCGPNRFYARSPVAATVTPATVAPGVTTTTLSQTGPVSASLPAPPWMQSIGSQGVVQQPLPVAAAVGTSATPVVQTSSGVFIPSPSAASPIVASTTQTSSGVFVPSPANASIPISGDAHRRDRIAGGFNEPMAAIPVPATQPAFEKVPLAGAEGAKGRRGEGSAQPPFAPAAAAGEKKEARAGQGLEERQKKAIKEDEVLRLLLTALSCLDTLSGLCSGDHEKDAVRIGVKMVVDMEHVEGADAAERQKGHAAEATKWHHAGQMGLRTRQNMFASMVSSKTFPGKQFSAYAAVSSEFGKGAGRQYDPNENTVQLELKTVFVQECESAGCFPKIKKPAWFRQHLPKNDADITGFDSLTEEDQERVFGLKLIEKGRGRSGEPPGIAMRAAYQDGKRKPEPDTSEAKDGESSALSAQQKEAIETLKAELSKKSVAALGSMLQKNGLPKSGRKEELLERVAEAKALGVPPGASCFERPVCPTCDKAKLRFSRVSGDFICPGFFDDEAKRHKRCKGPSAEATLARGSDFLSSHLLPIFPSLQVRTRWQEMGMMGMMGA
ncbi:Parp [Symbiodinium sp. CCMP2592]|nr:Parp [Symbiodinium sp. CCMP2592]